MSTMWFTTCNPTGVIVPTVLIPVGVISLLPLFFKTGRVMSLPPLFDNTGRVMLLFLELFFGAAV